MSNQSLTDSQRTAIVEETKRIINELVSAAEQVDVDRIFANFSDSLNAGFIDNGVFYPSLDSLIGVFREDFSRLKGQEIEVSETRVSVLAPNAAVLTAHGSFTATDIDNNKSGSPFAWTIVYAKVEGDWKIVHSHQSFPREA